jgi:Ca-activated chloride channel family protein
VPKSLQVGLVAFADGPHTVLTPTQDRTQVRATLAALRAEGGTATGDALASALSALGRRGKDAPPAAIVLLSDGASTTGRDPVQAAAFAREKKIRIYTVALGTQDGTITVPRRGGGTQTKAVPPDPEALAQIARVSGGKTFTADTSKGLTEVYERLGSQLGHKLVKRQVTQEFAGGGLLLLLGATAMSLGWFGRLV